MNWFNQIDWGKWVFIGLVIGLIGVVVLVCVVDTQQEQEREEMAWRAWVKETGNPKQLSKEEWLALMSVTHPPAKSQVVPMPVVVPVR